MRKLILILMLCAACVSLSAEPKSIYIGSKCNWFDLRSTSIRTCDPCSTFAVEYLDRQRVLDHPLQRPLQRTRSIRRIRPRSQNQLPRRLRQLQRNLPVFQQLAHFVQPQVQNVRHLRLSQRTEDHRIVHAVQKLRPEVLAQHAHHALARHVEVVLVFSVSPVKKPRPGSTS
jgi:hypothetical protein